MQYAGVGQRIVAALVDGFIVGVVQMLLGLVLGVGMGMGTSGEDMAASAYGLGNLLGIVIGLLYYVFYQASAGQTLGKKMMGIKVVSAADGSRPTALTFFLREIVGKFVSAIILFIGYLMVLWDGRKQGLHDKIAGTVVVKA